MSIEGSWPAADVVCAALTTSLDQLLRNDALLRVETTPEAVHEARVAVRRLRSDLRTFAGVLDREWTCRLRDELRRLGDGLAAARDADVLVARLERHVAQVPPGDRTRAGEVLRPFRDKREAAYGRISAMLRDESYAALLREVVDAVERPLFTALAAGEACDVIPDVMDDAWSKLRRAVRRRSRPPTDHELHRIRIKAKRVRYAAEAVACVYGRRARRFAKRVERLQTILGEQHDAVIAARHVREECSAGDAAFVAGQILALEMQAALAARERWRDAWRAAAKRRRRFWQRT